MQFIDPWPSFRFRAGNHDPDSRISKRMRERCFAVQHYQTGLFSVYVADFPSQKEIQREKPYSTRSKSLGRTHQQKKKRFQARQFSTKH
jgi:hypothetical protein